MASNLETIGLGVSDRGAFEKLVADLADAARQGLSTPAGDYAIWRCRSGAEVWLHIAPPSEDGTETIREIKGLTPFFEGSSEITLNITARINRPDDNAFEGAYHAWMPSQTPATGPLADPAAAHDDAYPLVFDAVDYAAFSSQMLPATCRARICGFCRELKAFPDEQAFNESQTTGPGFAAQSFFPVGLFAEAAGEGEPNAAPSSNALINGIVRSHRTLTNDYTGQQFHWIEVDSLAARYDILAAPSVVSGQIIEGGVVQAACWLFGRILK